MKPREPQEWERSCQKMKDFKYFWKIERGWGMDKLGILD